MLTKCMNILRGTQQQVQFGRLFSFSSCYQLPSIDNLPLNVYQKSCLLGRIVDKSEFILQIQNIQNGLLITRPRRWGKTMNLQMLEAFYGYTENTSLQNFNKSLFLGGDVVYDSEQYSLPPLQISEHKEFCSRYIGKYPIITITLSDVMNNSKEEVLKMLYTSIAEAYNKHIHLFKRLLLDDMSRFTQQQKDSIGFLHLQQAGISILYQSWEKYADLDSILAFQLQFAKPYLMEDDRVSNQANIIDSIRKLSTILTEYYRKPTCMLLMDEYDLPFNNMVTQSIQSGDTAGLNYLQDMLNMMFLSGVKTKVEIHKTIVMGTLPLTLSQLSTGWNDLQQCTVASIGELESSFGYTEEEVKNQVMNLPILTEVEKTDLEASIHKYYNGYTIGKSKLYNPFSVSSCLTRVRRGGLQTCLQEYWSEIGSVQFLENIIKKLEQEQLQSIMFTRLLPYSRLKLTYQGLMSDNNENTLLPTLLHLGYLTIENQIELKIPNQEMKAAFMRVIYPKYLMGFSKLYPKIWSYLDEKLEYPNEYLLGIKTLALLEINKIFEMGNQELSESYFTSLLSANILTTNHRIIRLDETTSDNKRIDMVYLPYSGNGNSLIIHELKVNQVARNKSEANEETLEDGLWQILCNLYPSDRLREYGTVALSLIVRVLLFAKTKTESKEEYSFEGLGYKFTTADAIEMMGLFENYDEKKRHMMVKGSEVKVNERKAAREEFLEHCKAKTLFELLEKYQLQK